MIKPIDQPILSSVAAMLMVSASTMVLKKNETMQWIVPSRRDALVTRDTSAVCPEVPMIAAK
jgi:hypothetical protein